MTATLMERTLTDHAGHYTPEQAMRLLEQWEHYHASGRRPQQSFTDGGIEQRVIATEAPWAESARQFGDLARAVADLSPDQCTAVTAFWRDGLRSIKRVGRQMGRREEDTRTLVWTGTQAVLEQLTGAHDLRWYLRLWREKQHMRRVT